VLAGSLMGLASVGLAPAHAASGSFSCSFGADTTHSLCDQINWGQRPWVLGDKSFLLELEDTDFGTTSGTLTFNYVDLGSPDPDYTGDLWNVNTDFEPVAGTPGSSGIVAYSLGITPAGQAAGWSFKEVSLGVDHGGSGVTVTKAIDDGTPIVSVDGAEIEGIPLSGTALSVRDTWEVGQNGALVSFSNTFQQTNEVPGPLPLLGAGAAFGFSRRLRRRIRSGSTA